ncbi:tumor necrosis factor receptor superfamily member 10B-like [Tympanuchus pallidicinctus]|uniref:tumor necrosis factor receptor superfamily member 10B-like n=1 Tax=Tympanuchus pallidicinctus TaxID=109042 RepID=UPI002286FA63|nr:tumor necrosis factor receptor superfamily member 10B-like [Tympanuchus pallidicinctus]
MRSATLLFCPVLLLLLAKVHLGSAAAVKKRAGESDVLEPDLYSKKCPMGPSLANDSSKCFPCKKDEYTEYPNNFPMCLGCRTCREDQVEVSPCIPTRNTQCACKNGTFCLPDHPCEMCQKCQTRCPKGQVRIAPCTQHSDLQCGPPLDISSSFSSIITITVLVVVLVFLPVFSWCCYRHCGAGGGRGLSRKPSAVVQNRLLQRMGIQDNKCNEQIYLNQQQEPLTTVQSSEVPCGVEMEEVAPRTSNPNVETQRKLVPVPGKDPLTVLFSSFNTFVEFVPFPEWRRFGRALGLRENNLYQAEQNDRGSGEPLYQMLNMWLNKEGSKASVNTLLETLSQISLSGVADLIASELVRNGYFQYEVS